MSYRTQPACVTDRIREAGAEVFAWHDRDLAALLDPSGKMRRRSQLLGTAALVALTVATLALSWRGSAWMLSMMFLGWGAYRSTWTLARWPVWTLVVAGALAMAAVNGALWLPLVLVSVGVAAFTPHTHRPGLVWASVLAALAVSAAHRHRAVAVPVPDGCRRCRTGREPVAGGAMVCPVREAGPVR